MMELEWRLSNINAFLRALFARDIDSKDDDLVRYSLS